MAVLEGREGIQYQKPSGQREESPFNLPPLLVCEDMGLMDNFFTTSFCFSNMGWDDILKNKNDSTHKNCQPASC